MCLGFSDQKNVNKHFDNSQTQNESVLKLLKFIHSHNFHPQVFGLFFEERYRQKLS